MDVADILLLLKQFGTCHQCEADLDGDSDVDSSDLLEVLGAWQA